MENRDPTLAEILADSENEENFEVADEKLSPVPAKDYDSVLIDENKQTETLESANLSDSSEVLQESTSEIVENNRDNSEVVEDVLKETDSFKAPESLITSLDLKEKIQFRVATINFRSGSSSVDGNGLKKIKKIVKIAKDRNAKIKIVGHASERTKDMPIEEHKIVNFIISDKRAHSVAKILIEKYGFPRTKLITEAVSDSKPLFKEIMPAGTKANQRTEIFLIY